MSERRADRPERDRHRSDTYRSSESAPDQRRSELAAVKAPASVSAGLGTRVRVHEGGRPGEYAVAVLDTVARIPPGKVMTYGDVAEYVGGGTGRHVGAVLARFGYQEDVPWHRVIRSTGEPNPTSPAEALALLAADGTPLRPGGERVDLQAARWDGMSTNE
ncbi:MULTISPECIES: MGMT family protein [unclassified Frankia]|uniref:MGMT family protein n=1 Tax=unclassified Frankia TaxID=2632575 RepID=UPI0027DC544B|nr:MULTISPECIES: MGMT family protein [unclassified Frankia]